MHMLSMNVYYFRKFKSATFNTLTIKDKCLSPQVAIIKNFNMIYEQIKICGKCLTKLAVKPECLTPQVFSS